MLKNGNGEPKLCVCERERKKERERIICMWLWLCTGEECWTGEPKLCGWVRHMYVTVSVYWVGVGMYSCMWKPMVHVSVFLNDLFLTFLKQGLLLNLGLTNSARLAGLQVPRILLSLPLQDRVETHTTVPCTWVFCIKLRSSHLCGKYFTYWTSKHLLFRGSHGKSRYTKTER